MIPYLTDRTTIETDGICGMKRFMYKHAGPEGRGIVPAVEAIYFAQGREIHHDLSILIQGDRSSIQAAWDNLPPREAGDALLEPAWRRVGWLIAANEWLVPRLMASRKIKMVECELILDRTPLWVASTADLVLEIQGGLYDGQLEVIDYKSLKRNTPQWQTHWAYALQMHLQIAAVQEETKQKVAYARVIGLLKGEERYGRLQHKYVWGYEKGGKLQPDYAYGLSASPVWDHFSDLDSYRAYVLGLGEDEGMSQFPSSHKVFRDDRLISDAIIARTAREQAVREGLKNDTERVVLFEPRHHQCRPSFGSQCPYLAACHNAQVNEDPIGSGLYVPRQPHHEVELTLEGDTSEDY